MLSVTASGIVKCNVFASLRWATAVVFKEKEPQLLDFTL